MPLTFMCNVEVRFNDIDIYGHVNNAVYLTLMEQARVKFFNHFFPNHPWDEIGIIIGNININYLKPIIFSPEVTLILSIDKIGNKSFILGYKFLQNQKEMANATSTQVCFDYKNRKSIPIPKNWFELFSKSELS